MLNIRQLQLPKFNRAFLKGLFWLLFLLFLASIINVARGVYDIFLPRAEVRQAIIDIGTEIDVNSNTWSQHAAIVRNRGNADAKDVRATLIIPGGELARVKTFSTESYQHVPSENEEEYIVELDRLAPGGDIVIFTWLNHPYTIEGVKPILAVTVSNGTVETMDTLTALEEIRGTSRLLGFGLTDLLNRFVSRVSPDTNFQSISEMLWVFGIYYYVENNDYAVNEFRYAFFSILALSFGFWIFLSRGLASILVAISFGIFSWLYLDFTLNITWLIVATVLAWIPFIMTKSVLEKAVILLASVGIIWWNDPALYIPSWLIQASFNAFLNNGLTLATIGEVVSPYTISGGSVVSYMSLVIILIGTEL